MLTLSSSGTLNTTLDILQKLQGTTHILSNVAILDLFCNYGLVSNHSNSLLQAFGNVREIHGYLEVKHFNKRLYLALAFHPGFLL